MATSVLDSSKLEKLFLRLVSISENEKLQLFLEKHLLDVIEAMGSEGSDILEKGMEFLNHLNRRIKSNSDVKLPLAKLLGYLLSTSKSILSTNFVMVYLKMGVMRAEEQECVDLLPNFFAAVKNNLTDEKVSEQLLIFAGRSLICTAKLTSEKWAVRQWLDDESFRAKLLEFFQNILAFKDSTKENLLLEIGKLETGQVDAPSSLTRHNYLLLAKELIMEQQLSIVMLKVAILKIVSSDSFKDEERLPLLVLAIANGPDEVETIASAAMRKVDLDSLLKNQSLCNKLFLFYLGSPGKGPNNENAIAGASLALKLILMPLFNRSQVAPVIYPSNIKVAFDGLFTKVYDIAKLKQLSAEFLLSIIKKCPDNAFGGIGSVIFSSLKKLVQNCKHQNVVCVAYQCFGLVGQKLPELLLNDLQIVQQTFDALSQAPADLASSIGDCLIMWLPSLCNLKDAASTKVLQTIISTYCQHNSIKCRLVALKFIESLVKTPNLDFRWTLCCAFGDSRDEMKSEAKRLLELSLSDPQSFPKFEELVEFFYRKLRSLEVRSLSGDPETVEFKRRKQTADGEVAAIISSYLFNFARVVEQPGAELKVEDITEWYPLVFKFFSSINSESPDVINLYMRIVYRAVTIHSTPELLDLAVLLFYCTNGRFNLDFKAEFIKKIASNMVSLAQQAVCSQCTKVYILCLDPEEKNNALQSAYIKFAEETAEQLMPCDLWMMSFLISEGFPSLTVHMLHTVQSKFISYIESSFPHPSALFETACCSLAESYRRCLANLDVEKQVELLKFRIPKLAETSDIFGKISLTRKEVIGLNVKEAVVKCLGFLSTSCLDKTLYDKIVGHLYAVGEGPPMPELQFTVGNSLFDAVLGEYSPSRRNFFVETEDDYLHQVAQHNMEKCEERALELFASITLKLRHTNRHLRQAAFIWLFVLVDRSTKCHLKYVHDRLCEIQNAFINGLAENDDFVQEIASQGIGIVFSLGNEEQRKAMVSELVNFLTSGRKSAVPITGETQLFAEGELGAGPSGESLTTYKELCSLATDLNQPDLIYKFMQLANHKAVFNTKKGAAYGFNIVMQQAKAELETFLPEIVPKLYRYRYDPDPQVMTVMRNLWQVITSSQKNVAQKFAPLILGELLSTLTNSFWRVRESSCLAIADLLSSCFHTSFIENAGILYETLFRLNDDIKCLFFFLHFLESVRLAAKRALKSLFAFTTRNSSSEKGENATRLIGIILPVLVKKGMCAPLKENRMLSLKVVMDVSKEAGSTLQPHLPVVIPCLLESLSEVEPSCLNYLAARSSTDELELLDTARASAARTSPMVSVLHDLIPLINKTAMETLCPSFVDMLKNSVGVSTRLGTAQFLIDLCLRQRQMFVSLKHICDKLVNALINGLRDRNPAVRKQFSVTLSYITKYSSLKQIDRILSFIVEKLEGEEGADEMTAYGLLRAFADNSSEILSDSSSDIIPYVFLICSKETEKDDEVGKKQLLLWEELWNDIVPGTNSAIRLYKNELLKVVSKTIRENPVWARKAQAATMLSRILQSNSVQLSPSEADDIFCMLASLLRGKIWTGKEKILASLSSLLQVAGTVLASYWKSHEIYREKFSVIWRECLRKNYAYSAEAVVCASFFCASIKVPDKALDLISLIKNKGLQKRERSDSSDSETGEDKVAKETVRVNSLNRLFSALPHCLLAFENNEELVECLQLHADILESSSMFWKSKTGLLSELWNVIERWPKNMKTDMTRLFCCLIMVADNNWNSQNGFSRKCLQIVEKILEKCESGDILLSADSVVGILLTFKESDAGKACWTTMLATDRFLTSCEKKV